MDIYYRDIQTQIEQLDSINHLNTQNELLSQSTESMKNNDQNKYIKQSNENNVVIYEMQLLKGKQISLLNYNLVYKENINSLSNINKNLETELHTQH